MGPFSSANLPGVGEGDGVSVEVVLPLEEVLLPRADRLGVTDELPLVPLVPLMELLGDVVLDVVRNWNGTVDFLGMKSRDGVWPEELNMGFLSVREDNEGGMNRPVPW